MMKLFAFLLAFLAVWEFIPAEQAYYTHYGALAAFWGSVAIFPLCVVAAVVKELR